MSSLPEVWLRGPLPEIPAPVQPVAHALLQSREELHRYLAGFPDKLLWERPAGVASAGFHLLHIRGVLNRLFTYARKEQLSEEQLHYLREEESIHENLGVTQLTEAIDLEIDRCLDYLKKVNPTTLSETREVGRKKLPSTHLGLLVHASEHTQRHIGQLYVTVRILLASAAKP